MSPKQNKKLSKSVNQVFAKGKAMKKKFPTTLCMQKQKFKTRFFLLKPSCCILTVHACICSLVDYY